MEMNRDIDLLQKLYADIEVAWTDHGDDSEVDRLAAEHPEHSEALYEFFSMLVLGEKEDAVPAYLAEAAADTTMEWLNSGGLQRAMQAADCERRDAPPTANNVVGGSPAPLQPPGADEDPRPFLTLLMDETGREPPDIAAAIGDVTSEFLFLAGRHANLIPPPVRTEWAARVERALHVSRTRTLPSLSRSVGLQRAASRSGALRTPPTTFEELVEQSDLTPQQQRVWIRLVQGEGRA